MNKFLSLSYWLYLLDVLLKKPNVNNGFIDYAPSGLDEIHYEGKDEVLGNVKTVLIENGDWRPYRPTGENPGQVPGAGAGSAPESGAFDEPKRGGRGLPPGQTG